MHRRRFCRHTLHALCALSTVPLLAACMGGDPFISLARLQEALQGQFPRPVALLPGLELQLLQPTLRTLPEANRLGAHMPLQASGTLLGAPREGLVELDFGLRFMPQDGTLRAHELRVQRLELAGLPPAVATLLQGAGAALLQKVLQDAVLYTLHPPERERLQRLGVQAPRITVEEKGLRVQLNPASA